MYTISLKNLSYSIPYADSILEDINFNLGAGEFIGVLGHNGAGKTTLIDLVLGLKKASQGEIQVMGENPHGLDRKHKDKIAFLSQDINIKGNLSIAQFLKFHSSFYPDYSSDDASHLMEAFELDQQQKIGSLSTGQQKKVQAVAAFSCRPKLILIDEITAVMDPETRDIFFRELSNVITKHSSSVLLATNIAEDLINRADKILFIENKKATVCESNKILHLFNIGEAA